MLKSYLAIIDTIGLREIHEEHEETALFLNRVLANSSRQPAALIWVVMDGRHLAAVEQQIQLNNRRGALDILQAFADQSGSVSVKHPMEFAA